MGFNIQHKPTLWLTDDDCLDEMLSMYFFGFISQQASLILHSIWLTWPSLSTAEKPVAVDTSVLSAGTKVVNTNVQPEPKDADFFRFSCIVLSGMYNVIFFANEN